MKPYICAICGEQRDARENPPTSGTGLRLICDLCDPDPEPERPIPLSEIPATIKDLRAKWAQEYTMRGKLERENLELHARIAEMVGRDSRNVDDLTDHCARQGAYIARLQDEVMTLSGECADLRDQLVEALAGPSGKDCGDCGGTGLVEDEEQIGDPGAWHGYRTKSIMVECEACFGHGRVQK